MRYKQHTSDFKSKVALAAIKGDKTIHEKDNQSSQELKEKEKELDMALKKIGQLTVESEWVKKK